MDIFYANSELNPASSLVTGFGEARGMGYWAAAQVKGLSPRNTLCVGGQRFSYDGRL